jgi:hypothetical protein
MSVEETPASALDQAWKLLASTARSELAIELPREAVMAEADRVSSDSSWSALDYLLAWNCFLEENSGLPPVLADLVPEARP